MLTNTADIELFLDRHYEDIYWVSKKILAAQDHTDRGEDGENCARPLSSFSWSQFEWFCAQLLRKIGWTLTNFDDNVSCGQASNNSRADIIAEKIVEKKKQRIFVSCKRYATPIPISFVEDIINVKNKQQNEFFDEVKNIALLMTTNTFSEEAEDLASQNQVEYLDFYKIKELNLKILISENRSHKWQPKFGKFAKIQEEHGDFLIRNKDLMKTNQTLRQQIEQEKTERENLENEKNNLQFEVGNLNAQIEQNRQNQAQNNHQNWQKDQQKFIRQNQDLENQKHEAEIRIAQIGLALDEKATKISQQEKELNREKTQNQIGTRINFGLLKEKYSLNQNIKQIEQKTSQILWQKDLEKSKLTQKYQHNSRSLEQNLQEESLGKIILSTSLIIVFGLFLTMSFWIILN